MKHELYKVKIGAEKPWEKIEAVIDSDLNYVAISKRWWDGDGFNYSSPVYRNSKHPLSALAGKCGAIIFGGFGNEKDFIIALPSVLNGKAGDIIKDGWGTIIFNIFGIRGINKAGEEISLDALCSTIALERLLSAITGNVFQKYAETGKVDYESVNELLK